MPIRKIFLSAAGLFMLAALEGCSTVSDAWEGVTNYVPDFIKPYRADVHQGNLITNDMVTQLERGMTDAQVQFLLGVPLLRDQFHPQRWDYVYYSLRGNGEEQLRRLTVFFDEERRLDHWVSDAMPSEEQADQMILGNTNTFSPEPQVKAPEPAPAAEGGEAAQVPLEGNAEAKE